jgi:type I restriction-modification system DNA methylase subunit
MSSRVTLAQIVENITQLSSAVKPAEFIYDFLTCFGVPKATIARLKGGALNVAKKEGCTLLKTKVYFEPLRDELPKATIPMQAIEAAQKDSRIAANKPRFLIATDFKTLAAFDTKRRDTVEFPIGDLHEHYTFFLPLAGMEKSTFHAEAEADVKAAENMAKLYDLIRADNPPKTREERHALNVFLTRLLFCYFAEDTGIFPDKAFTSAVESYTQPDGSDLVDFLKQLFLHLNTEKKARSKTPQHLVSFDYVNGGLFSDTHARQSAVPVFSTKSRQKLIELGTKSWKEINPDIFGSMFQGVVDDEKRAELGMHYTSVPNIMKVIRPLFLDELYAEFEKAKGSEAKLNKLLSRIYRLRIFDPACGSGNFLIIAYKELRRLEMAVFQELQRMAVQMPLSLSGIQVSQFYGIELDDFAHEVAILALWLAEHQMNIEFEAVFGKAPASLPLKDGAKIVCGNALQREWQEVCPNEASYEIFVLGNPPYYGARKQTAEQKLDVVRVAGSLDGHKNLDYIACFFLKAAAYVRQTNAAVAFVATNSVCQGEQVALLWPHVLNDLEFHFAYQAFKWVNSAKANAGVTCVIIGIRQPRNHPKRLFGSTVVRSVENINPYLVAGRNKFVHKRRSSISAMPPCDFGNMPNDGGGLMLRPDERDSLVGSHPSAGKFVRRLLGTEEFIDGKGRFCLWISDAELREASEIPFVAGRIAAVRLHREDSDREATNRLAARSHQFGEIRHQDGAAILIPRHTSERREYIPSAFLNSEQIIHDSAIAIYAAAPWIFGIVSSKMHMVWSRAVAGGLETRVRYSSSICYNNFPFPQLSPAQREKVSQCAEAVLIAREHHPEKTIAWLYDPDTMPEDLLAAHRALDEAVEQCYRTKPFTTDEQRLEYLFGLYEQMTAAEQADLLTPAAAKPAKNGARK